MKKGSIPTIVVASLLAQLILSLGLENLKADCPSLPDTANNQSTNGSYSASRSFVTGSYTYGTIPSKHSQIFDDSTYYTVFGKGGSNTTHSSSSGGGGGIGGGQILNPPEISAGRMSPGEPYVAVASSNAVDASKTVNAANGDFVYQATDLTEAAVMPLKFTRCYISSMAYNGPMGYNFDYNFNRSLELQAGCAYYHTGQGYKIQLNYTSDTSHAQSVGSSLHLTMSPCVGPLYFKIGLSNVALSVPPGTALQVADAHGNRDIYDMSGYLLYAIDRDGNAQKFTRDTGKRLISVTDLSSGRYLAFTLDSNGRITAVTDSTGRVITYEYDPNYNLIEVNYPATAGFPSGTNNQYQYDSDERMTTVINGNGHAIIQNTYGTVGAATEFELVQQTINGAIIHYAYGINEVSVTDGNGFVTDYYNDSNGNVTRKVVHTAGLHTGEPSTYETDFTYDSDNQLTKTVYPKGNSISQTYDSYGDVLTIVNTAPTGTSVDTSKGTQATTSTTTYTYESRFNQVATVTDPNGNVTTYDYGTATSNPAGDLLSITSPTTSAGTAHTTFTYDSWGHVLNTTEPDGVVMRNEYTLAGALLVETIADYGTGKLNSTTHYTYDTYGHRATIIDPNGHTTSISTNAQDQVTEVDYPSGQVAQYSYDATGNQTEVLTKLGAGQGNKIVKNYNNLEQVTQVKTYTGASSYLSANYSYDGNGNLNSVTDPAGHATTLAYDERNLPYLKTDALGHTTRTDFDANGITVKLTDELNHATTYAYDGLDALEQKTYADGSYETWRYDTGGRMISRRTTAGNVITESYNACNLLVSAYYGSTIAATYDITGRLLTATEGGTSLSYAYDALSRVTSFTDQAGHTSTYTYDLAGNRLSATYPTGAVANYTYDASNRPLTVKDGSGTTLSSLTYDSLDRVTQAALGNGTTVTPSYDLLNRITGVTNTLASTSRNYSYVYDNVSRITSVTEPRGTIAYGYTNRNELNTITEPSGSPFADQTFVFDAAFNRSTWTLGTSTKAYTVNDINQYTAIASATPVWNSDGGLSSYHGISYLYDELGKLVEADYSGGKTLYSYDPFGRRVKKINENTSGTVLSTISYHYDGANVAVEYQPSTTWTYYGALMRTDGTNKQWYYHDGQGSVSAVTDNSGNLLEQYEYTAQGHVQIANGSGTVLSATAIGNDLLYAGYRYDSETGNYFCNARYYSPEMGRFISRDPLSGAEYSQGTNLYAYCGNDCANETDPSGMSPYKYPVVYVGSGQTGYWINGAYAVGGSDPASAAVSTTGPQATQKPRVVFGGVQGSAFVGLGVTGGFGLRHIQGAGWAHGWGVWFTLGYGFGVDVSGGVVEGTTATDLDGFKGWYDNATGVAGPISVTGMYDLGFNNQLGESVQVGPGVTPIGGEVSETYTWSPGQSQ